jgi:hypothetical protein
MPLSTCRQEASAGVTTTEQIVYAEAVRAIEQQPTIIDELRSRTSILLAASGIVSGVLASAASRSGGIGAAGAFAIVFLAVVVGLCISVLLPRWKGVTFVVSPKILLEDHVDVPERNTPEKLQRFLAEQLEVFYDENERAIERLYLYFWLACIALSIDIALWLLELVT